MVRQDQEGQVHGRVRCNKGRVSTSLQSSVRVEVQMSLEIARKVLQTELAHTPFVILSAAKNLNCGEGVALRCFASLSMTTLGVGLAVFVL